MLADEMDDGTHTPAKPTLLPNYKYSFAPPEVTLYPANCWIKYSIRRMNQNVPMSMGTFPFVPCLRENHKVPCLPTSNDPVVLFSHRAVPMGTSQFQLCNSSKHDIR